MAKLSAKWIEFKSRFYTEEACFKYLIETRWPGGLFCSKCKQKGGWKTSRDMLVCKNCRAQISVTSGTAFHQTRKSLRLWFDVLFYIVELERGTNINRFQKAFNIGSHHTAWQWLNRIKIIMDGLISKRLSGNIEVDYFNVFEGEKFTRWGNDIDKKLIVAVAVTVPDKMKKSREWILTIIPDNFTDTLRSFIKQGIAPQSKIYAKDYWPRFEPFSPETTIYNIQKSDRLPHADKIRELFEKWLEGTDKRAFSPSQIDYYLVEVAFFDQFLKHKPHKPRKTRKKVFDRLLAKAVR